jgi:flagellin
MVISNSSTASMLSNIYTSNSDSLSASLGKLASGKRVQSAGDDFAAYVRASGLRTDIATFQNTRQDLQNAKGAVDYSVGVGNAVLEDLTRLKELQDLNTAAAGDADKQAAYSSEYDAIVNRVNNTIDNSAFDGQAVYGTASIISAGSINVTATNSATNTSVTAGGITTDAANMATAISAAQTYVADLSSFQTAVNREMKLNDTIIAGKDATISALINVDEVEELAKVTNLQVRQQATVSMMSQANVSQSLLARLFS